MPQFAVCHFCQHRFAVEGAGALSLPRVTSDCRPAPRIGVIVVCPECCLTQTVVSEEWRDAAAQAYREYAIYESGGGAEQKVAAGPGLLSRSEVIVGRLAERYPLAATGRLLDFGCGNGGFLSAFGARFPGWELDGAETDSRHLGELRRLPGFRALHGVDPAGLPANYDVVSLVHVLEHLESPGSVLALLRDKVERGGLLLVEVPSWRSNPFALMISDHASHFTPATLQMVVTAGGWTCQTVESDWVPKELSLVGVNDNARPATVPRPCFVEEQEALHSALQWLSATAEAAGRLADSSANFGLFGSAIAATWLYQSVDRHVRFFVDEDPQRSGRTHLGLPILAPDRVPADADVFVGVSPEIAPALLRRLESRPGRYHAVGPVSASGLATFR